MNLIQIIFDKIKLFRENSLKRAMKNIEIEYSSPPIELPKLPEYKILETFKYDTLRKEYIILKSILDGDWENTNYKTYYTLSEAEQVARKFKKYGHPIIHPINSRYRIKESYDAKGDEEYYDVERCSILNMWVSIGRSHSSLNDAKKAAEIIIKHQNLPKCHPVE
jgi:hypothetical protein